MKEVRFTFLLFIITSSLGLAQLPQDGLKGHWTFDNASNLEQAAVGNNLVLDALTGVTATKEAVEGPTAGDGAVSLPLGVFFRCNHDLEPNGGGTKVNQYSLVFDFKKPVKGTWSTFFGTNANAAEDDWEMFVNTANHVGIQATGYSYDTIITNDWYRVVVVAELGSSYRYYMDGQLLQDGGVQELDGRFAISSINETNQVLFLGDNDGDDDPMHVAQIALYNRALTVAEIEAMGGFGHSVTARNPVGLWNFDDSANLLAAATGKELELTGSHQPAVGPTSVDGAVTIGTGSYYTAIHGIHANGGTAPQKVNVYSMIIDLKIPAEGKYYSIFQTNPANDDDADFFINPSGNLGTGSLGYSDTALVPGEWYRMVITADLGNKFTVYLDGDSVHSGTTTADGALALDAYTSLNKVLFFADNDGEDNPLDVAYIALYNRVLSNDEIVVLGGYDHGSNSEITGALQSVYMDGSDNNRYMKILKNSDMDFGTQNFTIELWIKPRAVVSGDPSIISNKNWESGANPGWVLSLREDDWKFNMADVAGNRFDISAPTINDGYWHHLAVVVDRVNGGSIIADSMVSVFDLTDGAFLSVGSVDTDYPVVIGQDGTENYFYGAKLPASVDEVRIWKAAVSPEVLFDWKHKKINSGHPNYADLVGYYNFDEGTGSVAADLSGKGHNAELINNPAWKISYAPIGDQEINETYSYDVSAIWGVLQMEESGGLTAEAVFEEPGAPAKTFSADNITAIAEPFAIFGHDNKNLASVAGLPAGVQQRLNRTWYFDVTEASVANAALTFDLSELGGNAAAGTPANYVLLGWNGSAFSEVTTSGVTVQNSDQIVLSGVTLSDSIFTLGTKDIVASPLGLGLVAVETNNMLPKDFSLEYAYPNPFNPVTNIKFTLPVAANVKLTVFNILGAEVATLVNSDLTAGYHDVQWNSLNNPNGSVSSGVYFYRLTAKGVDGKTFSQSRKVILMK